MRGSTHRNDYVKVLDSTFQFLANETELGLTLITLEKGIKKHSQSSHVIYYKHHKVNQILIVRILHKSIDVNSAL
ncbi:MAG: type II toxin-antitoxin system RelE/ParE family toxin [Alteromonadaceae bacterium]